MTRFCSIPSPTSTRGFHNIRTTLNSTRSDFFKFSDPDGRRYRSTILTGSGTRNGASGKPWRGIDPTKSGRHWAIPSYTRTLLRDGLDSDVQSSLDKLDAIGRVLWPSKEGGTPSFKQYIDDMLGVAIQDVWTDIAPIASQAKERINYPTQKPLSLLGAHHQSQCQPWRRGARPILWLRDGLRSRRQAGASNGSG